MQKFWMVIAVALFPLLLLPAVSAFAHFGVILPSDDIIGQGDNRTLDLQLKFIHPAEDKYILHYTKVCISAFGLEDSWDRPLGVETEIVPLSRPYALWTGNLFSAQVLLKGVPAPFAEIEVEYLNEAAVGGKITYPADPFVAQRVKADSQGVFHYAMPKAGWWGFAALADADWKLLKDGKSKSVEIGAVYWVKATDLP